VTAIPQGCLATVVGKPVLAIEKTGPTRALIGTDVAYNIIVRNTGSSVARDVVVTDTLPDGLVHASGDKNLTMKLAYLAPGEARQFQVAAKAAKTGKHCNPATAQASNAKAVKAEACTEVVEPKLELAKTGPKEEFIGKTADYTITVTNPGDAKVTNVVVTDHVPDGTRVVSAAGAQVSGGQASWTIAELAGGAKQTYQVTLTTATAGTHCNRVAARSAEGLTASAEACTVWKGQGALLIELVDNPDPILVGDSTKFVIRVTNQGTADARNIKIVATFEDELDPTAADGQTAGTIKGDVVTFGEVPSLAPKQTAQWTITAKGMKDGDHRLKVDMTSDLLKKPVTEEESTHVY
jgi:uncharacterized repeat protein (TIGR01451 family)